MHSHTCFRQCENDALIMLKSFVYDSANCLKTVSSNGVLFITNYYDALRRFSGNSGLLICEAKSRHAALRIEIKSDDTLLYS